MSTEQNKAVSRRFVDLFSQGDLDEIERSVVSRELVVHGVGGQPDMDLAAFRQLGDGFKAGFPNGRISVESQIAEGDRVVTRTLFRGTHTGTFNGIPPTGRQVTLPGINIDRITDARIAERWDFYDLVSMMQQLGVIGQPAQGGRE